MILEYLHNPKKLHTSEIVYGHFYPVKYIGDGQVAKEYDIRLVTILRDPIDRLISHYKYWRISQDKRHYLWKKMHLEGWDFFQFALSPEMKNFYAQHFSHTPLNAFTYIGIYEDLEPSVRRCIAHLGISSVEFDTLPRMNISDRNDDIYLSEHEKTKLMEFHSDDYLIYNYALQKFHYNATESEQ